MTIVLLNTTPIVRKLVQKLAQRRGDTLLDAQPADGSPADIAVVDDSVREDYDADTAKSIGRYTLFIGSRFDEMPQDYDAVLAKPFLPDELDRALDDAAIVLAADVGQADIFDADEAASSWADENELSGGVFAEEEIDEVRQLLDAVDEVSGDESVIDENIQMFEQRIGEALGEMDEEEWDRPYEEILYDASPAGTATPAPETGDRFGDLDLHARGVEALQDLMAILSDESVAKALKSMGVRIDISFGEKA